jgi:hypothetical protein
MTRILADIPNRLDPDNLGEVLEEIRVIRVPGASPEALIMNLLTALRDEIWSFWS